MTIRISQVEYDLMIYHCRSYSTTPSEFICKLIREQLIEAESQFTEDDILKISAASGNSPIFVERILKKYAGNWKLQAQTLFRPTRARLSMAEGLEEFIDDKAPDYTQVALPIAQATGFAPTRIEGILKRFPDNIELQVLELFKGLSPRIEPDGSVTIKLNDRFLTYPLNSLREFAELVKEDVVQVLPTELDVARLTEMIEAQGELPSNESFNDWYKKEEND